MDIIKAELERLFREGLLRPADVVEAARDPESPLHTHFEWDDTAAAAKWREEQARQLIRNIRIEVGDSVPVSVRAFVSLPVDRQNGAGYRRFADVIDNEFLCRQLAADIQATADRWERRARAIGAMVDFGDVRSTAERIGRKKSKDKGRGES